MEKHKKSILYYTDCFFFAGCEKMLVIFFSSLPLQERYSLSLGYKYSKAYVQGVAKSLQTQAPIRPFRFLPEFISLTFAGSNKVKRLFFRVLNRILLWLKYPAMLFEITYFCFYFRKNRPDILHLNNGGYPGAHSIRAAAIAAGWSGIRRIVMVVNSTAYGYDNFSRKIDYLFDRLVARSVSKFVTGSGPTAARLREALKLPEEKVVAIHNGVLLPRSVESKEETRNRLSISAQKRIILSVVSLLIPRQGHLIIFEAIKLLRERKYPLFDEILVLVEGFGFLERKLREFIERNGLQDTIKMIGREANIGNIYNITDIALQHTVTETDLPNVISESMGWGKPVIATDIAGIPEQVIHGKTGLLCKPGDIEGLASAIATLCSDQRLRQSMGLAALNWYKENFTPEVAIDSYMSLYESLDKGKD